MFVSNNKTDSDLPLSQEEQSEIEALELKIQVLVVEKFLAIVREREERDATYKSNPDVLKKGFWYGNTYYRALKETKAFSVLESIRRCGFFYDGLPPDGFTEIEDASYLNKTRILSYTLKEGVKPTEALRSIRETLCFIDCQIALEIAYYEVLLELLGEEVFNQYFCFEGEHALSLDPHIFATPLGGFYAYDPLIRRGNAPRGSTLFCQSSSLLFSSYLWGSTRLSHALYSNFS